MTEPTGDARIVLDSIYDDSLGTAALSALIDLLRQKKLGESPAKTALLCHAVLGWLFYRYAVPSSDKIPRVRDPADAESWDDVVAIDTMTEFAAAFEGYAPELDLKADYDAVEGIGGNILVQMLVAQVIAYLAKILTEEFGDMRWKELLDSLLELMRRRNFNFNQD